MLGLYEHSRYQVASSSRMCVIIFQKHGSSFMQYGSCLVKFTRLERERERGREERLVIINIGRYEEDRREESVFFIVTEKPFDIVTVAGATIIFPPYLGRFVELCYCLLLRDVRKFTRGSIRPGRLSRQSDYLRITVNTSEIG